MLITIGIILLLFWILGIAGVYTLGWFIHLFLVIAIILFVIGIIQGRRVV